MHPTSAGATYPSANALVESNIREDKTIDDVALLASATARNRDIYANLSGSVALLMSELVITNKNLVEALKGNTHL